MSTDQKADLGPMPEPEAASPELYPGGVDAVEPDDGPPTVHDLMPEDNPALEDEAPDELSEPEDTDTQQTEDDDVQDKGESSG